MSTYNDYRMTLVQSSRGGQGWRHGVRHTPFAPCTVPRPRPPRCPLSAACPPRSCHATAAVMHAPLVTTGATLGACNRKCRWTPTLLNPLQYAMVRMWGPVESFERVSVCVASSGKAVGPAVRHCENDEARAVFSWGLVAL